MQPEQHERGCALNVEQVVLMIEHLVLVVDEVTSMASLWIQTPGTLMLVTVGTTSAVAIAIINILTLNVIDFV